MIKSPLKEMRALAKEAAEWPSDWVTVGLEVYGPGPELAQRELICRAASPRLAEYLARAHNNYLLLSNVVTMLIKKVLDRRPDGTQGKA